MIGTHYYTQLLSIEMESCISFCWHVNSILPILAFCKAWNDRIRHGAQPLVVKVAHKRFAGAGLEL
jgi:hypothetical protein